jgi:hypothetical protein
VTATDVAARRALGVTCDCMRGTEHDDGHGSHCSLKKTVTDESTIAIRRLRCPKCKSPPRDLIEVTEAYQRFAVTDNRRDVEGWNTHGDAIRLIAECQQGHQWRVRGAVQVTCVDLRKRATP